jgi:hypothetical protein
MVNGSYEDAFCDATDDSAQREEDKPRDGGDQCCERNTEFHGRPLRSVLI